MSSTEIQEQISSLSDEFNPDDYVLFIQTTQGQTIRTLIEAIEMILPEENIKFTSKGISMLAGDATQTLLVNLQLYAERFEQYHCARPIKVGISIINLLKIVKMVGNLHTLTMYMTYENQDEYLYIRIDNPDKNIRDLFRLNLLDLDREDLLLPDEEFPSIIMMPGVDFQTFVRDMNHIGNYVTITTVGDMLSMKVEGDFAQQEKIFGGNKEYLEFLKKSDQQIIQGEFNLRCLVMFSKCTKLCNNIEICLKNDYPIIIRYHVSNLGEIKLALAPRSTENGGLAAE